MFSFILDSLTGRVWYKSRPYQYSSYLHKVVNVFQKLMQKIDDICPKILVLIDKKKIVRL